MRILNSKLPDPVDGSGELQDPHLEQSLHDEPEDNSDDILADDNLIIIHLGPQQRRNRITTRINILITCS